MTTHRTIDPYTFFERRAAAHKPQHAFIGRTKQQFAAWKRKVLPRVLDTLGARPEKVALKPELLAEWREDGLVKQRWVFDTQPGLSAILLLFRPAGLSRGERRPAILCCHGHGPYGKDPVMGIAPDPEVAANMRQHNYSYGLEMARSGFVTYAIDWLGFGERDSRRKPFFLGDQYNHRDPCNVNYLCATMLGTTLLAMNCHDASRATDFVSQQKYVEPTRFGVMGCSLGGTMTTWMTLTDDRFHAADNICYAGPWHDIAYRTYNVCGSQVTPGVYEMVDVPELHGLIAPRPLLIETGIHDDCFHIDHARQHFRRLAKIYKAAGAAEKLELDVFPGPHAWGGNKSVEFFREYLRAAW